ncbi:FAD-dependent oxidoreductase [Metabacillus litoralis]|uniref:FAD-dependent oxidoreductase n=1 Tax=Metabacillus litoralis TaxID=152268 RepID=UPI0021F5A9E8
MSHILLVGGGHAHLTILRSLLSEKVSHKITLISASTYQYYSGMFSGFTEGVYHEEEIRINIQQLCQRASIEFIEDTIVTIDPIKRTVIGESATTYTFDIISFDIGSNGKAFNGNRIKPNYLFTEEISMFRSSEAPTIIGGGAAGVELALSTLAWRKAHTMKGDVTLVSSSPLLSTYGDKASKKIKNIALQKGLKIHENERVENVRATTIVTKNGREIPYTQILSLTGPTGHKLFQHLSPTDNGFLQVTDDLNHRKYPFIFGAGDCITLESNPTLPKNGVYAVRQGPILWENIKNYLSAEILSTFKPQRKYLSILSTGNKQALLTYGDIILHGKLPWRLKHFIDKKFINQHEK